jgi:hypothetical protein
MRAAKASHSIVKRGGTDWEKVVADRTSSTAKVTFRI